MFESPINPHSVFNLTSKFSPKGDQPEAISKLYNEYLSGAKEQVLLGVTGSGKTFTMANLIQKLGKKTLILAHNKTLAAQLYSEFKEFFPDNAVEYFVSYYDYYQPEAYVVGSDTYIEKDASVNDEIDKLRHSATRSLLERDDVIVVASVSCIYGIGSPSEYRDQKITLLQGDILERDDFLADLVSIQYLRNDIDFSRGNFRVRGDIVEIFPSYEESNVLRVEFFDNEIDSLSIVDPLRGTVLQKIQSVSIYPKSHYVVSENRLQAAIKCIRAELRVRLNELELNGKLVEKQRLEQRTLFDLEMMEELGFCSGIENYSRHLTGLPAGHPPPCLLDFFGDEWLMFIDESHITCSQVGAMYKGDRSRKQNLVDHGFRLPSAMDNRPLKFDEFETKLKQTLYVSATPGKYELELTKGEYVEQIIRPTGLLDPEIFVKNAKNQVDDLLIECKKTIKKGFRVLITTLTKKLAEDLSTYYNSVGLKVKYLHSDINTLERMEILRDLRLGEFDVLIGINLLREGLDLPEVALVGILDADKEGFLRSERSLIQTIGRAARNSEGKVILYAYNITKSMQKAIDETKRRRGIQNEFNLKNNIQPKTIIKDVSGGVIETLRGVRKSAGQKRSFKIEDKDLNTPGLKKLIKEYTLNMKASAKDLDFEQAAKWRDQISELKEMLLLVE